jgi:hypothetical protein
VARLAAASCTASAQREQIAVHAEAADLSLDDLGKHRDVAERLARMDVAHVLLDHGAGKVDSPKARPAG